MASTSKPGEELGSPTTKGPSGEEEEIEVLHEDKEGDSASLSAVGGWISGWFSAAKEKGAEVLDLVKKDIDEFALTVGQETSHVVSSTSGLVRGTLRLDDETSAVSRVKSTLGGLITHVSETFTAPTTRDGEEELEELFTIRDGKAVRITKEEAIMEGLREDPRTYTDEPEEQEEYENWMRDFDLEEKQTELCELLACQTSIRDNYAKLVPKQVSHVVFWHHYYYKRLLVERELAKMAKAKKDLSESEQRRLLCEYEAEKRAESVDSEDPDMVMVSSDNGDKESLLSDDWEKDLSIGEGEATTAS